MRLRCFIWRRRNQRRKNRAHIFCAVHLLFCCQFQRRYKIGEAAVLRQLIQRNELLFHVGPALVTEFAHIARDDRGKVAQPITIDHHPTAWLGPEGCLKVGWSDDASMLFARSDMRCHQFLVGKQFDARGVNAREMRLRNLMCSGGSVKINEKLGAGIRELNDA